MKELKSGDLDNILSGNDDLGDVMRYHWSVRPDIIDARIKAALFKTQLKIYGSFETFYDKLKDEGMDVSKPALKSRLIRSINKQDYISRYNEEIYFLMSVFFDKDYWDKFIEGEFSNKVKKSRFNNKLLEAKKKLPQSTGGSIKELAAKLNEIDPDIKTSAVRNKMSKKRDETIIEAFKGDVQDRHTVSNARMLKAKEKLPKGIKVSKNKLGKMLHAIDNKINSRVFVDRMTEDGEKKYGFDQVIYDAFKDYLEDDLCSIILKAKEELPEVTLVPSLKELWGLLNKINPKITRNSFIHEFSGNEIIFEAFKDYIVGDSKGILTATKKIRYLISARKSTNTNVNVR